MPRQPPRSKSSSTARRTKRPSPILHVPAEHPKALPIVTIDPDAERMPDQPFAEGARDGIDPDLRHRMISEAAYRHYVDRGYEDGYDVDDWLQAETDVDHLVVDRAAPGARRGTA